MHERTTHFNSR